MGLGRQRQDCEFEAKLGYTERHYPMGREKKEKRGGKKVKKKKGKRVGIKGRRKSSVFKILGIKNYVRCIINQYIFTDYLSF